MIQPNPNIDNLKKMLEENGIPVNDEMAGQIEELTDLVYLSAGRKLLEKKGVVPKSLNFQSADQAREYITQNFTEEEYNTALFEAARELLSGYINAVSGN